MILETDVTTIAYVTAWNRQEHRECGRIVLMEITLGIKPPALSWIEKADDYEIEALIQGISVRELLGVIG